jgi:amino acid transporter
MCPTTLFGSYGLVNTIAHGMIPFAYVIAAITVFFTAYSYYHMSKAFPVAGSAYSYVGRIISPYLGFLAGWSMLLDYVLVPMVNYLLAAIFLSIYIPGIPFWAVIMVLIVIVCLINHFGITTTAWANNIIVVVQIIFYVALMLFIAKWLFGGGGAGTFFNLDAFYNSGEIGKAGGGVIVSGAAILMINFIGFDAITTVAEEAHDAKKNIGRAIIITVIGAACFFTFGTYMLNLAWPNGWQEYAVADNGAQELIVKVAGSVMGVLFTATYVVATTASAIAAQSSAARILYGMGRDAILPKKIFGYINPKRQTPTFNILLIGVISMVGAFMDLDLALSLLSFGALVGFTGVNISLIFQFFVRDKRRGTSNVIKFLIVPALGAAMCIYVFLNLTLPAYLVGGSWVVIGFVYLCISTSFFKKKPKELDF